tara:strand:- start:8354 stop:10150 length:1797 start_codon:yes stop_codon:yes gene_type:complete
MPKQKNIAIKYTSRDFQSIKDDLLDHASRYYSNAHKDFTVPGFGSMVLDTVAYAGDVLSYYLDYSVNESFLDTAIEFQNVRKHARALGYNYSGTPSSYGVISLYILCPANSDGTAPDTRFLPVLKRGASFSSGNGNYILTEDVVFNDAKNEFVAARFNNTTGATTFFAVKAQGQVVSGQYEIVEIDLTDRPYERFKRVRVGSSAISDIFSVKDSNGNLYYEVDNLSQEVVFIETTNKNAAADGVRSIIKPFVASRRFTVERDDTGTFLQFGFGSEDEDSTGVTDPAKVALKMHGKKHISSNSFDPTQLLSTDKLGIAPYNTILSVVYKLNSFRGSTAAANSISTVGSATFSFLNESSLDSNTISTVENSLEVNNEEALTSTHQDITVEEIKQRAKAYYATQNRAVTKQDYESLIYNMPAKFGAIKRANIISDPSGTNRRMALYVVSEDADGNLATTNQVVKNNIRNWLTRYKIMNDVVDIFDAKVVNFGVKFEVIVDRRYDNNVVLYACIKKIQDYFAETFYIGEPLYTMRIYDLLHDVDGVADATKVTFNNKVNGLYSPVSMNFDEAMSKDGTFLKTPKNVILELKFPSVDIIGVAR